MNKSTKKVFLYCRKSSEGEDRQMLSIPSQVKELKQHAEKVGLTIIDTYTESKSAKAPGRPKFGEMMNRLYNKEAEGVLCWKLDRLARNPVDGGTVIWAVKDQKVDIITPAQVYSYDNENTLLMYVEFGMAQKFIDDLGKNVRRGLKTKAEEGWLPDHTPLGYKNTPDRKKGFKIVVNDEIRFPLVKRTFEEILKGKKPTDVYREAINNWGLTSKRGKKIAISTFYNMLNNHFYYGEYEYPKGSGIWYQGKHEPMITRDEFDIIQRILGKNGKPSSHNHKFDLTGVFRCEKCKCAITATKKIKHYKRIGRTASYTYYHCTKKNKGISCDSNPITEDDMLKIIGEELLLVKPSQEFIDWSKKWITYVYLTPEFGPHSKIVRYAKKYQTSA